MDGSNESNTSYTWTINHGNVIDTSANTINIRFDSIGTFTLNVVATNQCSTASGTKTIKVVAPPDAHISDSMNGATIFITDTAATFTTYHWSFGDGNISTVSNPNHTYTSDGSFTVILTATNQGCSSTDSVIVQIVNAGIGEITIQNDINIIPNPNNGTFTLAYNLHNSQFSTLNSHFVITDVTGRTLYSYSISKLSIVNYQLSIPLSSGVYFWQMLNDGTTIGNGKIVVIK